MAVRLTPAVKKYLEHVLATARVYVRLSVAPTDIEGEMSYAITWTDKIFPKIESGRTACDGNVIVIERKYEHFFNNILLGLDESEPMKVFIVENPNVISLENGKFRARE